MITVAVLNRNGGTYLRPCLVAVNNQTINCRKILIDNASTDGSDKIGSEMGFHVYRRDNRFGLITGLNACFELGRNTTFYLSNDVMLHPRCLEELSYAHSMNPDAIIQPTLYNIDGSYNHIGGEWHYPAIGFGRKKTGRDWLEPIQTFSTAAHMMDRMTFQQIGLWDTGFGTGYYEDVDYSLRAKKLGVPLYLCKTAKAIHLGTKTYTQTMTKKDISAQCARNRRYLIKKHYKDAWLRIPLLSAIELAVKTFRRRND